MAACQPLQNFKLTHYRVGCRLVYQLLEPPTQTVRGKGRAELGEEILQSQQPRHGGTGFSDQPHHTLLWPFPQREDKAFFELAPVEDFDFIPAA